MFFNSINFLYFLLIFTPFYFLFRNKFKIQNIILLYFSLFFYYFQDKKYLLLLLFLIIFDFYMAKAISNLIDYKRKIFLFITVACNLTILIYFKYF
jgi:alginate O-acetyltransferase complex protein AlgI